MSQIRTDFYLLSGNQADAVWLLACRLLEKAYLRGHRIFVYCDSKADAEHLDELLWTFKIDSFIPHHLQGEGPEPPPPVQIGYDTEPRGFNDILLNLSSSVPSFFTRFRRIIEIIADDDTAKDNGRQHYRHYRRHACALHTHQIEQQKEAS